MTYFYDHVDDDTDQCILWPYVTSSGYGVVAIGGRKQQVHVLACERHYGPMPEPGMFAIHAPVICHNRRCFNWRHLSWGTRLDNSADMVPDGTRLIGEQHPNTHLTQEQVDEIRTRYTAGGVTQYDLADEYGVQQQAISRIVNRRRWKDA